MSDNDSDRPTGGIETIVTRLRDGPQRSRRAFLQRSAAVGGGALALAVGGSNLALARADDDDGTSDVDVLNFALTLEHLENAFYREGLERFGERDLQRAEVLRGFGSRVRKDVRSNLVDIGEHEATHVETLTGVIEELGGDPVEEAHYDFGVDDASEFIAVAGVLENTGVSAYDGAIDRIENGELVTAGATIATVEARHASYLNLLNDTDPFPKAFDQPKSMEEILEAADPFLCG